MGKQNNHSCPGKMHMLHEGALYPEDDLTDYRKDFSAACQGKSTRLQIRDLRNHKSGLSNTAPVLPSGCP